ncbi:MAG TPA: T9SS type A sorting domain-containing protein [Ignavibacteriaceae bacterium]|nr:T9SS type A sorting domain-containing protein [Ignavibacteriaceae bacterium]
MKNMTYMMWLMIFVSIINNLSNAQWIQLGPVGEGVISLSANNSSVFAGTLNGVWHSVNDGLSWEHTTLDSSTVGSIVHIGTNVFAGTSEYGIYRSSDNGINWTHLFDENISSLAFNENSIFAGSIYTGVYRSNDNGNTWNPVNSGLENNWINCLAVRGANVYAGTEWNGTLSGMGVYYSINNGINWSLLTLPDRCIKSIAVHDESIFVSTQHFGVFDALYRSTDNGVNWAELINGLPDGTINDIEIIDTNIFVATEYYGVFLSKDNGGSWTQINEGMGNQTIASLAISPDYIYAGTLGSSTWRRPLSEIITSVEAQETDLPSNFNLAQNYPNPFNPSTKIRYSVPISEFVTLKVYDVLGNEVAALVNEEKPAGTYEVNFNASQLSSGIYFYKLQAGSFVETKKMILLR